MADTVGGHGPEAQGLRQVAQLLLGGLLLPPPMALRIDEDAVLAEGGDEPGQAIGVGRVAEGLEPGQGHEAPEIDLSSCSHSRRSRPSPFGTPAFMRVMSRQRAW